MNLINGKQISEQILNDAGKVLQEKHLKPRLDIIFVGDNSSSAIYVKKKEEVGKKIGVEVQTHRFETITDNDLQALIRDLGQNPAVNGIIIQYPVPGVDVVAASDLIPVEKDVDGLNSRSLGLLWQNRAPLIPATPRAIMVALQEIATVEGLLFEEMIAGKNIVILNRTVIIGKPLAAILTNMNATVTIAHSKTKDIERVLAEADIIVSGAGVPGIISADRVKKGAIVIDAGFTIRDGRSMGDVGTNDISAQAAWLSPVPNGIGPLGVACLIANTVTAALNQAQ